MTKKEFIKRMNEIKNSNLDLSFNFTCEFVYEKFGKIARHYYRDIIRPYCIYDSMVIAKYFNDCNDSRKTVRILALTTFEIECLESGIYKEF